MRINIVKSKNAEQLYIIKSYRKRNGSTSTKIFKKLGNVAGLMNERNETREEVIAWAKEQAAFYTKQEKEDKLCINVSFDENKEIGMNKQVSFNAGYLYLKSIFYSLKLDEVFNDIKKNSNIKYKLTDICEKLIYSRIISPSSKLSTYEFSKSFLESPKFDLHQVYRALDVLNSYSDLIQAKVYENSMDIIDRNTNILYYDCTNYFFEIEDEDEFRKYGKSKEHRPNPIVQMGLFLDGNGIPLSFSMFDGSSNEQLSLKPLEKKILNDFNLSKFIICTDAGLSSTNNRKFNNIEDRAFVTVQSIKKLKKHLKDWALSKDSWKKYGSDKIYNLNDISDDDKSTYYKERWINENDLEQKLIISYSNKYRKYQENIRERQVFRAVKMIDKNIKLNKNPNSPSRFISEINATKDGEVAESKILSLNTEKIQDESIYDGFYCVCTNLEGDAKEIIDINHRRWEIEESFRIMKSEFKARPVYLSKEERIRAHFLTCFLALLIYRILEKHYLKDKYTSSEIIKTLKSMNMLELTGFGYIPTFKRTDLVNDLQDTFDINLGKEIISTKTLKKILKYIKK